LRASVAAVATAIAAVVVVGAAAAAVQPGEERGLSKTVSRAALPGGLALTVEPGSVAVERGGLRAPLSLLGRVALPRALKGVEADDSGHIIATITDSCDQDHAVTLTLADLNARLDDVAAETVAAAQVEAGRPADAVRTLSPLLARAPIATYARVVTAPALASLVRRPELAKLRGKPTGTAKLALGKGDVTMAGKGTAPGLLAVSTRHRLIAAIAGPRNRGSCAGDADLLLLDLTGAEVTRLPLYATAEKTIDEDKGCPFARPARPKIGARVAAAQRLLADLGFSPAAAEVAAISPRGELGMGGSAQFPRAQLRLTRGPEGITVHGKGGELQIAGSTDGGQLDAALYLPDLAVVVVRWLSELKSCAGVDPAGIQVIPVKP
jgi:hypothetical protein